MSPSKRAPRRRTSIELLLRDHAPEMGLSGFCASWQRGLPSPRKPGSDRTEEGTGDSAEHGPHRDRHPGVAKQLAQEHPSTACVGEPVAALLEREHSIDEPREEPANGAEEDQRGPSCPGRSRQLRDEEAEETAYECGADHQPESGLLRRSVKEDESVGERGEHEKNGSREGEDGAPHGRSIVPRSTTVHRCSYIVALKLVTVAIEVGAMLV
jgi:hypothetical protein